MSEYEDLIEDTALRYPHLVIVMSGPWRDENGDSKEDRWICNFKNRSLNLQNVHPGSGARHMIDALKEGIDYLDQHRDEPTVRDYHRADSHRFSPAPR